MFDGQCGDLNPNCPCMEVKELNGKKIKYCSKGYPNHFQQETLVLDNGLALYARPRDGRTVENTSVELLKELLKRLADFCGAYTCGPDICGPDTCGSPLF
uniref:Uncharacterized protein n=2 Tax=Meloidogyne TaxID=189290 RepID=A0A6V7UDQ8_MELEN|nr:unnamed protein product [Meloidogyne enterolobii]